MRNLDFLSKNLFIIMTFVNNKGMLESEKTESTSSPTKDEASYSSRPSRRKGGAIMITEEEPEEKKKSGCCG